MSSTSTEETRKKPSRSRGVLPAVFLIAAYAAHFVALYGYGHIGGDRQRIRGIDPVAYYAYFHSLYFDRDLDFTNQYEALGEGHIQITRTENGLADNHSSIGPSIALAPFFIAADFVAAIGGWARDGMSAPYHIAAFAGFACYGLTTLLLLWVWAGRHFGAWNGAFAALMAWGSGSLMYYCMPLTLMPHVIGAAFATLFLCVVDASPLTSKRSAAIAGALLGAAMLARWQNALLVLYPGVLALGRIAASNRKVPEIKKAFVHWALFGVFAVLAFSPQMAVWQTLYHYPLGAPQGEEYFFPFRIATLKVLFSTHNGLFAWTPGTALALVGLAFVKKDLRIRVGGLALVLLFQLYLNSIVLDWHGAWGFGSRRFTELTAVFAFGWGALFSLLRSKSARQVAALLCALVILWNEAFILQFNMHLISWNDSLTAHEMVGDKLHLRVSLSRRALVENALRNAQEGKIAEAFDLVDEALRIDPEHDDVHEAAGLLYESVVDYYAALYHFDEALRMRPTNKDIRKHRDRVAESLGIPKDSL